VLQLPGLELLRASLERRLADPPVTKLTGLRLSEVGLGMASAWMPASAWWQSAAGVFLAGTTAFVANLALRGREVDTAGDGFLIAFDGAARAVQCAMAVRQHLRRIGLEIRSGVHVGECEEIGGQLVGIAVHIGSRVLGIAEPGEVLVSGTVRDLVAGSAIEFDDRGEHTLKGIAGPWRLYAARAG
jgi:class 3 adenylate cyclase